MKAFQLITFLCLIIYAYQTCASTKATKKEDCTDNTGCSPISKYKYKNIKDYIKILRLTTPGADSIELSIDCKSLYLQISLLSILLLL